MKRKPVLVGIGGAHVDRRGVMHAPYIRGASIPGQMAEEVGGGMYNALRVAAQFGVEAQLMSARGGDGAGEAVAADAKRRGITDLSSTFLDRATASYTALLDSDGDVVAALADMDIYETALPRTLGRKQNREAINAADGILIDANMPETAILKLVRQLGSQPVFALAISPAKAVRLRPVLTDLTCLYLNKREAKALCDLRPDGTESSADLARRLHSTGLRACVLTDGANQVCLMLDGAILMASPPPANRIVDVTGAGDAMCGATTAAVLHGIPLQDALKNGLAAASMTVESVCAVVDFSRRPDFNTRMQAVRINNETPARK